MKGKAHESSWELRCPLLGHFLPREGSAEVWWVPHGSRASSRCPLGDAVVPEFRDLFELTPDLHGPLVLSVLSPKSLLKELNN